MTQPVFSYRLGEAPDMDGDTFKTGDRRELARQGFQLEQVLKELGEIRTAAKDEVNTARQFTAAHEARIRVLEDSRFTFEDQKRLRALEDAHLTVQTQVRSAMWWVAL